MVCITLKPFDFAAHGQRTFRWVCEPALMRDFLINGKPTWDTHVRYFSGMLADETKRIYAILREGEHIGNCGLKDIGRPPGSCELWLYIGESGERGRGAGLRVVDELCRLAFGVLRLKKICLHVAEYNTAAIALYRKSGFVPAVDPEQDADQDQAGVKVLYMLRRRSDDPTGEQAPMSPQPKLICDPNHGYLRIDPVPDDAAIRQYYQNEFYAAGRGNFNDSAREVQEREKAFNDTRWERMCQMAQAYFSRLDGLSVFDIGFGYGYALQYFQSKGLRCAGIEVFPEAVAYAREMGIEAHQGVFSDFTSFAGRNCDIVTLINVLEHLQDPFGCCCEIREKLLSPAGLLIVEVPNEFNDFQTAADAEYQLKEWWVVPPNHINYFTADSIQQLLEQAGYEVIRREASFPLEMFLLFGEVYVGNPQTGATVHGKRVRFEELMRKHGKEAKLLALYEKLAELNLGRQTVCYAIPRKGGAHGIR